MAAVNKTDTLDAADLEELLDAEIPCGGLPQTGPYGRRATLHTKGHGCSSLPSDFKCTNCWMVWYELISGKIANYGSVLCRKCMQQFDNIDSFSHYRPI